MDQYSIDKIFKLSLHAVQILLPSVLHPATLPAAPCFPACSTLMPFMQHDADLHEADLHTAGDWPACSTLLAYSMMLVCMQLDDDLHAVPCFTKSCYPACFTILSCMLYDDTLHASWYNPISSTLLLHVTRCCSRCYCMFQDITLLHTVLYYS